MQNQRPMPRRPNQKPVKKPESIVGQISRHVIFLLAVVAIPPAATEMLCAQTLQSSQDVSRNDGVPRHLRGVTVEQNLGGTVPTNLPLVDSRGRKVKTGYFIDGQKPTIITLNYSSCPMLCSVQLNQLTQSLNQLDLQIGRDFNLLTVSIDPSETTAQAAKTKAGYVSQLERAQSGVADGWAFCTASQSVITALADVLGFRYRYDPPSGEYFHPAMAAYVSPDGVITRYSLDVGFEPDDMKLAIVEASNGTVGSVVDQFILWCSNFDPNSNSYVPQAWLIMRLGGLTTIVVVLAALVPYWVGRKGKPPRVPPTGEKGTNSYDTELQT